MILRLKQIRTSCNIYNIYCWDIWSSANRHLFCAKILHITHWYLLLSKIRFYTCIIYQDLYLFYKEDSTGLLTSVRSTSLFFTLAGYGILFSDLPLRNHPTTKPRPTPIDTATPTSLRSIMNAHTARLLQFIHSTFSRLFIFVCTWVLDKAYNEFFD